VTRETGALIRERATINLLVDNLSEGVILLDRQGRVVDTNEAADRLFGEPIPLGMDSIEFARHYRVATPDGSLVPPEREPGRRALAGETVRGQELSIERPDGRRAYVSISASPVVDGELRGALLLLRDISERVRRDREAAAFQLLSQQLAGSELDINAVYKTIVSRISEITGAGVVRLLLYESETRTLHRVARHSSFPLDLREPVVQNIDDEPATLDTLAARTHLPAVVPEFSVYAAGNELEMARAQQVGSSIALPLLVRDDLVGTLSYDLPEPHTFDDAEIAFLGMVATQSAIAIHNATVFQQRSRERAFLADLIEHLPAGLIVFERIPAVSQRARGDYRVSMMNMLAGTYLPPSLLQRAQGRRNGLVGLRIRRLATDERAERLLGWLDEAVESGQIVRGEEVQAQPAALEGSDTSDPQGMRFWIGTIVPLRDRRGEVHEVVLLATNITEQVVTRRRIEELVRIAGTRAAELEATVSAMNDAVTVCDSEGTLRIVNRAALTTYGVESVAQLARMPIPCERIQLRHTNGTPVLPEERPLTRALAGETLQHDYTMFHHGLGRDIHRRTSAAPVLDASGTIIGAVAVETDITGLIEVDRLKDEFFSMAAHELRTPLTAMKGYVQILLRQLSPFDSDVEPIIPRALATLRDQGDRMERLINELLDVARIDTGQLDLRFGAVELVGLVEQLVGETGRSTQRHTVTLTAEPRAIPGRWDRDRLAQVFANLLSNAVKYSPEGGTIEVSLRWDGDPAHTVAVAIRDQGVGIEPDAIPRLFARYSRVGSDSRNHYQISGLGVGLYITKQIVDAHNGTIHVASTPGHGSTFTVTLPMHPKDTG